MSALPTPWIGLCPMDDNVIYLPGCEPEPQHQPVTLRIVIEPTPQRTRSGIWMLPVWFLIGFVTVSLVLS